MLLIKLIAGVLCTIIFAVVLASIYVIICLKRNPPAGWSQLGDSSEAEENGDVVP